MNLIYQHTCFGPIGFKTIGLRRAMFVLAVLIMTFGSKTGFAQSTDILNSKFAHAAPERCWIYSSWNAAGKYNSNSENHSERLLAEPEVRVFIDDLIKRIGLIGPAMLADRPADQQELIHSVGPKLANVIFTRAGCVYLESIQLDRERMPSQVKAAMLVDAGKDAGKMVDQMTRLFAAGNKTGTKISIGNVEFNRFTLSGEVEIELFIGNADETLIVGIGEQTIAGALKRIGEKKSPNWLADFQSHQGLKRVGGVGYLNAEEIRETVAPFFGAEGAMMMEVLGLGNLESIETCSGFSAQESVSRLLIRTDGRPEGVLDLSAPDGINSTELQQIPKDSLFAVGLSIDPRRTFRFIQTALLQVNGNHDMMAYMIEEIRQETGIDIRRDVIENLGKTWMLYNGAGDGWITGLTFSGTVRDSNKLSGAVEKLIKKIIVESDGDRYAPTFTKRVIGESELFTMRIPGVPFPMEPSWCITEDQVLVGLYPQAVQSALQRSERNVLIDQAQYSFLTQSFSGNPEDSKLLGMMHLDAATHFEFAYPYAQIFLSMGRSMFDDMSDLPPNTTQAVSQLLSGIRLPPARSIHKHLQPSLGAIRQTNAGIEFEQRQTIPSVDASYVVPIAVGMLLPAVQQVRTSARRTVSANNMRQQILASLNYESAHMKLPAGFSTNRNGDKLLSWRVHILPYIEQNNLYDQFNLDEPWDSDNNKRLIKQMPDVFRSPVSKADEGLTVYRGIGGKKGVLGAPRRPGSAGGVGFGNITDGSSNTLFVVETSDQLAVPWTQPDEGLNPDEFDLSKIFGQYPDGTNAGRCDGSVFFVPEGIDKRTFKLLMEMNDGNVIPQIESATGRRSRRDRTQMESEIGKLFVLDNGEIQLTAANMLTDEEKEKVKQRRRVDKLRQVALAMHNFESAHRDFPSAYTTKDDGTPLLSWRVYLLPYLEEGALYEEFRLDEPWDSEHNRALMARMPDCYRIDGSEAGPSKTTILANGGEHGVIVKPQKNGRSSFTSIGFRNIIDGSSNTIMLVEAGDEMAVDWTKPTDVSIDEATIGKLLKRKIGFGVALGDGSVHVFPPTFDVETLKTMVTRDGGEIVPDWSDQVRQR